MGLLYMGKRMKYIRSVRVMPILVTSIILLCIISIIGYVAYCEGDKNDESDLIVKVEIDLCQGGDCVTVPIDTFEPVPSLIRIADVIVEKCHVASKATPEQPYKVAELMIHAYPATEVDIGNNGTLQITQSAGPYMLLQIGPSLFTWAQPTVDGDIVYRAEIPDYESIKEAMLWLGVWYADQETYQEIFICHYSAVFKGGTSIPEVVGKSLRYTEPERALEYQNKIKDYLLGPAAPVAKPAEGVPGVVPSP